MVWAIIAVQLIVGVYGFIVLPDVVPIHWGANGQPNGYGPKWVDTFLFPLISLGIYLLLRVLIAAGPRLGGREVTATNLQIAKIVTAGTIFLFIYSYVCYQQQTRGEREPLSPPFGEDS